MSTRDKIAALAFHPSTPEPEAICAFLKMRSIGAGDFNIPIKSSKKKFQCTASTPVKSLPVLIDLLNRWVMLMKCIKLKSTHKDGLFLARLILPSLIT